MGCESETNAVQWCSGKFGAEGTLGGLGRSPQRDPGQSPWSGGQGPETESFFVFGYPKGAFLRHLKIS